MSEMSVAGTVQGVKDACRFVTGLHRERGRKACEGVTEQEWQDLAAANAAAPIAEEFRAAYVLAFVTAGKAAVKMLVDLN